MVVLKIKFGDDTRRVSFEGVASFASLVSLVKQLFPNTPESFRVKYLDDDGDLVTISTDIELKEALSVAQDKNVLRLQLVPNGTSTTASQAQTPQAQSQTQTEKEEKKETSTQSSNANTAEAQNPFANWGQYLNNPELLQTLFGRMSNAAGTVESDLNKLFKDLGISGEGKSVPTAQEMQQNAEQLMHHLSENPLVKELFPQLLSALVAMQQQVAQAASEAASQASQVAQEHFGGKEESSEPVLHPNIQCDGCERGVRGIRYKCSICADFDLCEACEAKGGLHDPSHPLLKISRPIHGRPCRRPFHRWSDWIPKSPMPFERGTADVSRPLGRFVCDLTIEDGSSIVAGETFLKQWRLRNEGTSAWPASTRLAFVGGDRLISGEGVVVGAVEPSEEVDVSMEMTAPSRPGRYIGYFRLVLPDGNRFGQRVWVDIVVVPKPEEKVQQESSQTAPMEEAEAPMEVEVPKTVPEALSPELQQLADMGFSDIARNKQLLEKYRNDVVLVIQDLLRA